MYDMLTIQQSILLKNKLNQLNTKLDILLNLHSDLKYILNETLTIDDHILEEDLLLNIENDINEIKLEINSHIKNLNNYQ